MVDTPDDDPRTEPAPGYIGGADRQYSEIAKVAAEGMHLGSLRTPKVRSVITARIAQLKAQLAAHEELIKQLDANPSTESLLDAMRKLGI
jgi:hypothetical protein